MKIKTLLISLLTIFVVLVILLGGALSDRLFGYKLLDKWFPRSQISSLLSPLDKEKVKVVSEESVVIDVVDNVSPSVVTIGIKKLKN